MCRDRKCQPNIHSATVAFHRRIEEPFHFGKGYDFIKSARNLLPTHAKNCSVQENVLPTCQLRVKSRPNLKQTAHAATQPHASLGWFGNPAENLEQRAFARSIAPDDAKNLSLLDFEAHVPQCPKFLYF